MKFAIYTLGCRVNQYESRAIAEHLCSLGHSEVAFNEESDIYIVNSCAVTAESVRKSKQITRRAKRNFPNAEIIIIGCAAQISDLWCQSHRRDAALLPSVFYWNGNVLSIIILIC